MNWPGLLGSARVRLSGWPVRFRAQAEQVTGLIYIRNVAAVAGVQPYNRGGDFKDLSVQEAVSRALFIIP